MLGNYNQNRNSFSAAQATVGDLERFQSEDEDLCREDCCGLPEIPEGQVSDCECVLTDEPTKNGTFYDYHTYCKQAFCIAKSVTTKSLPNDSVHIRRIRSYRKKIYSYLESIFDIIGNITEPDGIDEQRRRQQRSAEFMSWVGRNYHYVLQKQIHNIRKQTKRPCVGARNTFFNAISQKLVTVHQIMSQALQAYKQHLPSTIGYGVHEKLRELLKYLIELGHLNVKLGIIQQNGVQNSEDIIESKSKCLLMRLSLTTDYETETPCTHTSDSQTTLHRKVKMETVKKDLTMYEPKHRMLKSRGRCWKKPSTTLAKTKLGPPAKSKMARPASEKCNLSNHGSSEDIKKPRSSSKTRIDSAPKQQKSLPRVRSVGTIGSTSADNVETMMDFIPAEQSEEENCEEHQAEAKPNLQEYSSNAQGKDMIKGDLIETLIELTKSVRTQMGEETEVTKHKNKAVKKTTVKKTSSGKLQTVDMDSLNQIKEIMQQLEEILPKQGSKEPKQAFSNHLQRKYSAKSSKVKFSSKHSLKNQGEIESVSSNTKLIFVEHSSSEEEMNETSKNEKNAKEISNQFLQDGSLNKLMLSAATTQTSLETDVPVLTTEVDLQIPENWEPSVDSKTENGMIISVLPESDTKGDSQNLQLNTIHVSETSVDPKQLSGTKEELNCMPVLKTKDHNNEILDNTKPPLIFLAVSGMEMQELIDYRKKFHTYTSKKRMYEEEKKPWLIMTRVADHLIHDILKDLVTNEIGMHKIAKNLVELEFK